MKTDLKQLREDRARIASERAQKESEAEGCRRKHEKAKRAKKSFDDQLRELKALGRRLDESIKVRGQEREKAELAVKLLDAQLGVLELKIDEARQDQGGQQ